MAWLASSVALLAAAGCSSQTAGTPSATSPVLMPTSSSVSAAPSTKAPRTAASISTCDDLSDADIRALGLEPGTKKENGVRGQVVERGCTWSNTDTAVDIHTTTGTVAMYKARTGQANVQLRTVAGLPSIYFQVPNDPRGCALVSDIPGGGLVVAINIKFEHEAAVGTDSCTAAVRVMEQAAPILLKQK